jgi:hypothetical protein
VKAQFSFQIDTNRSSSDSQNAKFCPSSLHGKRGRNSSTFDSISKATFACRSAGGLRFSWQIFESFISGKLPEKLKGVAPPPEIKAQLEKAERANEAKSGSSYDRYHNSFIMNADMKSSPLCSPAFD